MPDGMIERPMTQGMRKSAGKIGPRLPIRERAKVARGGCNSLVALTFLLWIGFSARTHAQESAALPDYVPLLANIKQKAPLIDPHKGYFVKELKLDVYMMTEGAYESVFVRTGEGVVLFDAPPSFADHISQAVADVTSEPIVALVYSHIHIDHIGGAGLIMRQHPKVQILAEEKTAEFLREMHDTRRPIPTRIFKDHYTLKVGSLTANMKLGHWHTPEGDLLISIPDKNVVIAIDAFSSGATPFMGFDLTMNLHDYMRFFDQLKAMNFDVIVPGHHSLPASREDLETAQIYVSDVYDTMARELADDHKALKSQAIEKYGRENGWAVASVLINREVNDCANRIKERWVTKLEGVDIWAASHCRTALVYAEWDVGVGPR
jgi:glyoxylase-like metal-dependent hydrolase (beta-lactamase superfamily II)